VNNSKKCFSISKYNIGYVTNKYRGLDKSKLELSRLGAFSNASNHGVKIKTAFFRIGFISWFVEKKGIKYLLEAMKNIAGKNRNIKLILAGDGPLKDEIEQFIALNKLSDCIQYVGKLNHDEKSKFFLNLDAFVLPAITLEKDKDGIPVVLMEAISYGLPIISTAVSGIPEICINNFNGFLIPEKNVPALIKAISFLYNNQFMINRFSRNSLQLFSNYNIERNSYLKLKRLNWIE
jgi:glycosyltransferase involved in cell wall biosynthesis